MSKKAPQIQEKTPTESAPFDFDFSEDLVTGESITGTPTVTGSTDLTIGTPSVSSAIVQVQISGGAATTTYELTCVITTDMGNTYEGFGDLYVGGSRR